MSPRRTQPLKPKVPPMPPPPPRKTLGAVHAQVTSITQNLQELTKAMQFYAEAQDRQSKVQEVQAQAHADLAKSQTELNKSVGEMLEVWKDANGFWKVMKFVGKAAGIVVAVLSAIGLGWLFMKGGAPAVGNTHPGG